jgi:hypothetical protein
VPVTVSLPPDREQAEALAAAVRPVVNGCREALECLGDHCRLVRTCRTAGTADGGTKNT